MGKLFGTDGIRGIVNEGLDAELAYKVGMAAALVLSEEKRVGKPLFTIGKDTRISGDLLKGALIAGLCTAGADVMDLGTIPTPAVAWLTIKAGADAGIVISASHNPYEHNGIKVFDGNGFKLSDQLEEKIETIILNGTNKVPRRTHGEIGRVSYVAEKAVADYIDHLVNSVDGEMSGLRILVDCANGAAYTTAAKLFDRFPKLHTDVINADPDGLNINAQCGSTHMNALSSMVKSGNYDLGIAFDGDADRCLAVAENGEMIDGDQIMAICGGAMQKEGTLSGDAIVATVMSNIGLRIFAKENGLKFIATDVGDRNVLEKMVSEGYKLGGEQSGHMIFLDYATTGDGEFTALQLLKVMSQTGKRMSELASVCVRYPQVLINIPVENNEEKRTVMSSAALRDKIAEEEEKLCGTGRVLVRASGTEALIRVMVEGKEPERAMSCAQNLANYIKTM